MISRKISNFAINKYTTSYKISGMKSNIFDNMIAMMEKYANNLEMLVDERTHLLIEEKRKTDALLHEMLPKPVAEQLKQVFFVKKSPHFQI